MAYIRKPRGPRHTWSKAYIKQEKLKEARELRKKARKIISKPHNLSEFREAMRLKDRANKIIKDVK